MRQVFTNAKLVGSGIDASEYHKEQFKRGDARFVMSRSQLSSFSVSPSRWIHGYQMEDTDSTEYGDLMDCLVTDPNRFTDKFAVKPDTYKNEKGEMKPWRGNANVCAEWEAEHEGMKLLKSSEMREANTAVQRLKKDSEIASFLDCSDMQVMVTADYNDPATGVIVPVKILSDLVPHPNHPRWGKAMANFKTARNASPTKWEYVISDLHYHTSAALELDVYSAAKPEHDKCTYMHIISESVFPFEPGKRWLDSELIECGRNCYRTMLANYALCLKTGKWPGWDDDASIIRGWTQMRCQPYMIERMPKPLTFEPEQKPTPDEQTEEIGVIP